MKVGSAKNVQVQPQKSAKKLAKNVRGCSVSSQPQSALIDVVRQELQRDVGRSEEKRLFVKSQEMPRKFENIYSKRKKWVSKKTLTKLLDKHSPNKIERALDACINLWKRNDDLGMKRHEFFKIALFIETFVKKRKKHSCYIRKEKPHLARTIEYDRKTNRIFVHLKTHNIRHLGSGCHKEVTRSILYDVHKPQVVANSIMPKISKKKDKDAAHTIKKEIRYLKKFMGAKGLAETYAIGEHKKKHSHKKVISIIQKLYGAHSLYHYQQNPHELTQKEKLYVARDLIRGLESMHQKEIVHRDLHGCNVLLDRKVSEDGGKTTISAAIIDLGQAMKAKKAQKVAPKIQVPKRFNPAESFWRKKTHINAKAADVYALGLNLYHLYFGVAPEWAPKEDFKRIHYMSDSEKVNFRKKLIIRTEQVLAKRKKEIEKNKSTYYPLEEVILKMCDPHQKVRGKASEHRKTLEALIKNLKNQ